MDTPERIPELDLGDALAASGMNVILFDENGPSLLHAADGEADPS